MDIKKDDLFEVAAKVDDVDCPGNIHEDEVDQTLAARIRHRIDWRLVPALGTIYGISLMDRKNLANAAIAGMTVDLELATGAGYNIANMSFFITYILLQPLMVVLCRKIGAHVFLPAICLLWGVTILGVGFAKNWETLVPIRLILGGLEAGYAPACLYLMSCWYTRFEIAKRYSVLYLIGTIFSACSGILAYGLQQMEGLHGIRGWRWIFIMEGVITVVIALFAYIWLVKFPDEERAEPSIRFLEPQQLEFVIDRLNKERGDVELEEFTWKRFMKPATEWYLYAFPWLYLLNTTIAYAFAFTLPIILGQNLGFSVAMAQCLGAPPYLFGGILMYTAAWYSDRKRIRGPILCGLCILSLIGIPIMAWVKQPWVKYFGVFVTVSGTNSSLPSIMAYQANNVRGQWRRAFCSASLTGLGAIGGIAGAFIFRIQDAPHYLPGFITCIGCNVLCILTVLLLTVFFKRKNAQADRGEIVLMEDPKFRFTL